MRGSRAKALRTKDRPRPGRLHGGENIAAAKETDERVERKRLIRKLFPMGGGSGRTTRNLLTSKHGKDRQISSLRHSTRRRAAKNGKGR